MREPHDENVDPDLIKEIGSLDPDNPTSDQPDGRLFDIDPSITQDMEDAANKVASVSQLKEVDKIEGIEHYIIEPKSIVEDDLIVCGQDQKPLALPIADIHVFAVYSPQKYGDDRLTKILNSMESAGHETLLIYRVGEARDGIVKYAHEHGTTVVRDVPFEGYQQIVIKDQKTE